MVKTHFLFLCLVILVGCNTRTKRTGFFPDGTFHDDPERDADISEWIAANLNILQEPSLLVLSNDSKVQSYRLLLLHAFEKPTAVRLTIKSDDTGRLDVKIMDGPRENEPARLIESKTIQASQQQVTDFLHLLDKANFWHLPVRDARAGLDGMTFIIEGVKDGKYQVVKRWSPEEGAYVDAAAFLFELAKL
jgi:hypothetical protein